MIRSIKNRKHEQYINLYYLHHSNHEDYVVLDVQHIFLFAYKRQNANALCFSYFPSEMNLFELTLE